MAEPNSFRRAHDILLGYFHTLLERVADKVLDGEDTIDVPYGGQGEQIADRYAPLIQNLHTLIGQLDWKAKLLEPEDPPPPLEVAEVRCSQEEVVDRLREWLEARPGLMPVSIQTVPTGHDRVLTMIVHPPYELEDD